MAKGPANTIIPNLIDNCAGGTGKRNQILKNYENLNDSYSKYLAAIRNPNVTENELQASEKKYAESVKKLKRSAGEERELLDAINNRVKTQNTTIKGAITKNHKGVVAKQGGETAKQSEKAAKQEAQETERQSEKAAKQEAQETAKQSEKTVLNTSEKAAENTSEKAGKKGLKALKKGKLGLIAGALTAIGAGVAMFRNPKGYCKERAALDYRKGHWPEAFVEKTDEKQGNGADQVSEGRVRTKSIFKESVEDFYNSWDKEAIEYIVDTLVKHQLYPEYKDDVKLDREKQEILFIKKGYTIKYEILDEENEELDFMVFDEEGEVIPCDLDNKLYEKLEIELQDLIFEPDWDEEGNEINDEEQTMDDEIEDEKDYKKVDDKMLSEARNQFWNMMNRMNNVKH